jgi:hypothetical protein
MCGLLPLGSQSCGHSPQPLRANAAMLLCGTAFLACLPRVHEVSHVSCNPASVRHATTATSRTATAAPTACSRAARIATTHHSKSGPRCRPTRLPVRSWRRLRHVLDERPCTVFVNLRFCLAQPTTHVGHGVARFANAEKPASIRLGTRPAQAGARGGPVVVPGRGELGDGAAPRRSLPPDPGSARAGRHAHVAIHFLDSVGATSGRPNLLLTLAVGAWL